MKKLVAVVLGLSVMAASAAVAGAPKSYQVTGPVVEVKDDVIVVQKDDEKWEIAKDKDTKVTGEIKPGTKVTVKYTMKATNIEAKK